MGMTSSTNADDDRRLPMCCCLLLWAFDINDVVVAIMDLGHVCILQVTWVTAVNFYFTIAIAIVGLDSGCSCCCGDLVALGGKGVIVTKMLIENISTLLLMIQNC